MNLQPETLQVSQGEFNKNTHHSPFHLVKILLNLLMYSLVLNYIK